MGCICESGKKINDGTSFRKGEQYFNQTKDNNFNPDEIIIPDNSKDKVNLYFSLVNVVDPNQMHSFSISIINNTKLGIKTYLVDLEERSGQEIRFGKTCEIDYYFHRNQLLLILPKVNGVPIGKEKAITLSDLIRSYQGLNVIFEGVGNLIITFKQRKIREIPKEKIISIFQFTFNLKNNIFKDPINIPEIYFLIYISDNGKRALYKSQEFNKKNISSNIIDLDNESLTINGNKNTPLYIVLFCPYINKNNPIGNAEFNLSLMEYNLSMDKITKLELLSSKYDNIGTVSINYNQKPKITFIDYLRKGMQINLDIAIDYTASNNDPQDNPISLHNTDPRYPNDYERAIESCGSIVAFYDYDQLFPVYGFGGIPRSPYNPTNSVSHCFNVNFKQDPMIKGIENIILAYRQSLSKVTFAYPTLFSPVIEKVIQEIKYDLTNNREENHYYILLILTDGCINDMQQTRDKIVEASYLPMSIIIVGIGKADFTLMDQLDGDEEPVVNSRGEPWKRDIVQFVEFEKFKRAGIVNIGTDLTEEVLKEIPTQVEKYYNFIGKFYESDYD